MRLLGREHPEIALTVANRAALYADQGRDDEARAGYRRALAVFDATLSPDHPHRVICRENQAALLAGAGV